MSEKQKICTNCQYYKRDLGMFTVTGWTKSHCDEGNCRLNPPTHAGWPKVCGDDSCGSWQPIVKF